VVVVVRAAGLVVDVTAGLVVGPVVVGAPVLSVVPSVVTVPSTGRDSTGPDVADVDVVPPLADS
jgi:hypothetical protein